MRYFYALCISLFSFTHILSAQFSTPENAYQADFEAAYNLYPAIPKGFLEAYAYHNTRLTQLRGDQQESCSGMPLYYGVMGLVRDGKSYFRNNLIHIAGLRGLSAESMLQSPATEIQAFAYAYNQVLQQNGHLESSPAEKLPLMLALCEIPDNGLAGNTFAREAMLYEWTRFLRNKKTAAAYGFSIYNFNAADLLGANSSIHESGLVFFNGEQVWNTSGDTLQLPKSTDYAPAIWSPIPSCNYSSRSGTAVSAVTIHTVQGSYAGCISWFNNCSAGVSAHYVLRSSDGQVTQMVAESSKAWHVGTENPYTIGLEHEGYINNAAWYTGAMYQSSANLVKDILSSGYGINALRTAWFPWAPTTYYNQVSRPGSCVKIKGHQHFPNQTHTDPGPNWNWDYYFKLIHPTPAATVYTSASGSFSDSGGSGGNYSNDERSIYRIAPPGAGTVTVTFSQFSLENAWDYLYVYDGSSIFSPLIGIYTGSTNPGTLVATSGSMTFEFRSDCATTAAGWQVSWTSGSGGSNSDLVNPVTQIQAPALWHSTNFQVSVADSDSGSGIADAFFRIAYRDALGMHGVRNRGFLYDDFDTLYSGSGWTSYTGSWTTSGGSVKQNDENEPNSNLAINLNQNNFHTYLYEFNATLGGSGSNRRAGFHFMCDSVQKNNRGNSYFIWLRESTGRLEFYKVSNDVLALVADTPLVTVPGQSYNYKILYDKNSGRIQVWRDNIPAGSWTDPNPLQSGSGVSFRSGNARWEISQVQTYAGRSANTSLPVQVGPGGDIPVQNMSPSDPAGEIVTLLSDHAGNLSMPSRATLNIDWTIPAAVTAIADLYTPDADSVYVQPLQLAGEWAAATDPNSGIARYYYAVGTGPGANDVLDWTDNWSLSTFGQAHNISPHQWYYLSVYAENGAGLLSDTSVSDGFIWLNDFSMGQDHTLPFRVYPNPTGDGTLYLQWHETGSPADLSVLDMNGQTVWKLTGPQPARIDLPYSLSNGMYLLRVQSNGRVFFTRIGLAR